MYVRHLSLVDFRSWPTAEWPLTPGANVLIGRNGAGKTNLVEALGYLATLSSHRVASDAPLIARGAERGIIRAAVVSAGRELMLEVEITAGRANRARINRAPVTRARDILGVLRTVLFAPEDLALVRGDPSERRKFLDDVLIMRTPRLAGVKSDYDRVLKQRSALLKSAGPRRRTPGADLSTLDVWDEHLAAAGAALLLARLDLVAEINPHVVAAYADIAPASAAIDLVYRSSLGDALPAAGRTESDLRAALLEEMTKLRQQELERGVCLVGPHRDDLELRLGEGPAKGYASHGESWSLALALKLGAFSLLRSDGVDPVLVLDDVFAELDTSRRDRLTELVADADQVLITAAVLGDVPPALAGSRHLVIDGRIEAVA
ncbi:DNA replication/repair protein RecF [Nakamurella sp. PAMC28650]|jgi:DNA replication and repair protein RecF|uniref:DNA replication/repair protein RecF n=1 Tax=Nakamurella sp. PAMC28650 TaxID=2762325 RepID=UPI00164DB087|nr:DNA replication/repair protein RecF [Nakamurella sp. PAMC28650]QNK81921.1 DNA replication/repair protein RecF [Nakamurella sp. PAMC28650]